MGTLRLRVSLKVPGKILSDWESVEWALGQCGTAQECGNPVGVNQSLTPCFVGPLPCIIKDFVKSFLQERSLQSNKVG